MASRDQRRAWILTQLLVGQVSTTEAAELMGLSERQVWRLRRGFERDYVAVARVKGISRNPP
jgi:DNA-directed RNA polymerase specialized sigma24 family protein